MSTVAVIGEEAVVGPFALAGALVVPAGDPDAVRAAWSRLPDDVTLVLLTEAAARALGGTPGDSRLTAVMSR
jgi:vacuolar-type H+-ATPase subunit F/Vma7